MDAFLKDSAQRSLGLIVGLLLLLTAFSLSMILGQINTPLSVAIDAFTAYDSENTAHIVMTTTRVSRSLIALVLGASLAVAGALMQTLTRNPLASPSIFGVNAGALFFVVCTTVFFSVGSLMTLMWSAFVGGGIAAAMVFFLGSLGKDSLSPIKIVLSGAAISAFFGSFTQGLLVLDEQSLEGVLFWLGGSVSGRTLDMLLPILPFMLGAGILAFLMSNSINILTTGEDIAKGLGQQVVLVKTVMAVLVVLLAGGSVAVGGSIGFIGLIVPHIAKGLVGADYKWIIPYCIVIGGSLLLGADILARFLIMPEEMPIGVLTAIMGAPFFIYIARKGGQR